MNNNYLYDQDNILPNISVDDLKTAARCNGESLRKVFEDILDNYIQDAHMLLDQLEEQLAEECNISPKDVSKYYKENGYKILAENETLCEDVALQASDIKYAQMGSCQIEEAIEEAVEKCFKAYNIPLEEVSQYLDDNGYDTQSRDKNLCNNIAEQAFELMYDNNCLSIEAIEEAVGKMNSRNYDELGK